MTIPASGFYSTVMGSYFGYLDAQQKQDLWAQFLQKNGLTTNPSDTDPAAQAAFISYIQTNYSDNNVLGLSPEEVDKRRIMFDAFSIVLRMMTMLQNTVTEQSRTVLFLAKWQEQYTKLMGRVPTYVALPTNAPTIDLINPSRYTFGYNDISLQDIADYVAYTGDTSTLLASHTVVGSTVVSTFPLVSFSPTAVAIIGGNQVAVAPASTPEELAANIANAFYTLYQQNGAFFNNLYTPWRLQQPWPLDMTGLSDSVKKDRTELNSNVAKSRAEINTRNQTFLENARSQRQILRDQSKVVDDNLSQTREALNQQANLLNSIAESLRGLIGAICK